MKYADYLRTAAWLAKRDWAIERADNRCQICNSPDRLEVHHRSYENLGAERPGDIVVLCSDCHGLFHDRMAKPSIPDSLTPGKLAMSGPERALLSVLVRAAGNERVRLLHDALDEIQPSDIRDPGLRALLNEMARETRVGLPGVMWEVPAAEAAFDELASVDLNITSLEQAFRNALGQLMARREGRA